MLWENAMISVFMPAYNEALVLEDNVKRVVEALGASDFELFIVDDSSTDGTGRVGRGLAALDGRVRYVYCSGGPSRRENLAKSFSLASGESIVFIDADLSAPPGHIRELVSMLAEKDIVVGSRYVPGSHADRSALRLAFSRFARLMTGILFDTRISDHQCGLKAFRRDAILRLVEEAGYDGSMSRGFAWDTEILIRAQRRGYRIAEAPVGWRESERTSVRILRDWRMLPYMLCLRLRL